MSDEGHKPEEDESLRRFKALLNSENPHVQAHIRGFLDAMDIMHGGTRPKEPAATTATVRGGSLKDVLSQVASHIASVEGDRNGGDGAGPGKDDKALH